MYNIVSKASGKTEVLKVNHFYPMPDNTYKPDVEFSLCYSDDGFHAHFTVKESSPKAVHTEHFQYVHEDSCVEFFAQFAPELSVGYFNFEVNSIGIMNVDFRKDRDTVIKPLTNEDVESLGICAKVFDDYWTVDYTIPYSLIKKFIPGYDFKKGSHIMANVFKCGDETKYPHFGCWNMTDPDVLDFHRPEYFKPMYII